MHKYIPIRGSKIEPKICSGIGRLRMAYRTEIRILEILGRNKYLQMKNVANDIYDF